MSSASVQKQIGHYQSVVQTLASAIGGASVDWDDEGYESLQSTISSLASMSRQVVEAGYRTRESLARFERIQAEE